MSQPVDLCNISEAFWKHVQTSFLLLGNNRKILSSVTIKLLGWNWVEKILEAELGSFWNDRTISRLSSESGRISWCVMEPQLD